MSVVTDKRPVKDDKVMLIVTREGCPPCPDYKKMATDAAPKDVTVKEIKLGVNQEVDSLVLGLGVQRTPTAVYVGNGEVRMTAPSGKPEADRKALLDILKPEEETRNEVVKGCAATFRMKEGEWSLKLEGGEECEKAVTSAQSLGPGGRKNLGLHLDSEDPKVKELLSRLPKG